MSWAIWITGIPGSGKSTCARAAGEELRARGYPVRILELDQIRKTLTPEPRYTDNERDVVYRALGWMARLLTEASIPVIVDATYEQAGQPGTPIPGLGVPYEPGLSAELIIDPDRESVAEAAHRIAGLAVRLAVGREAPVLDTTGWAIWITGRPGTGKTTVTSRVVEALATRGVPVRALDLDEVRRQLVPGGRISETDREILHRALAYATKLLTEAGTAVIIDAAAPVAPAPSGPRDDPVLRGDLPRVSDGSVCRP